MSIHPEGHTDHISTQFNVELEDVKNNMLEMGGVVEKQITDAMHCLITLDSGLANDVITQ
jgi:phosphate transport system protein